MMRWTERQRAMLEEIGIRLWLPQQGSSAIADDTPRPSVERDEGATSPAWGDTVVAPPPPKVRAPERAPAPAVALGSRPTGVEAMDWPALREAVVACTACKLCQGRRQTVFGVGNERAQWMVVGEAPGEQEDRQGEPFVGKSGQLLDSMLRAIGLTRAPADAARQVYIANTIKCRPPGNRNPEPDELAQCEPFLVRQVALVQPKIILAMGRFAVQSLLRSSEPIGRLRGRVHRYQGVPLIVTYHPAYLLRNLEDKAKAWDDLCLAVQTFNAAPTD
jgi:uracil-DNA glycosylase